MIVTSATGDRASASGFSRQAATTSSAADTTVNTPTALLVMSPAGMARIAVRGLSASMPASATRLNAIAQLRAPTMATSIQPRTPHGGTPPAAKKALMTANGSAKTVCSNLIISRMMRVWRITLGISPPTFASG